MPAICCQTQSETSHNKACCLLSCYLFPPRLHTGRTDGRLPSPPFTLPGKGNTEEAGCDQTVQSGVLWVPLGRANGPASSLSEGLSCGNLRLQNCEEKRSHHVAALGPQSSDNEAGRLIKSHEACTQKELTSKASTLPLVCLCTSRH